ncbi:lysostaphin resistance A-like protein [Streptococcus hillyeri]|uniref:CPBP family intramembrane metalloprotease n=1 Tax=Streptococcus hillyeri TaxID=2282420 RepID=A0A3L9DQQ8_9STRE|nr:type II CAAX endopeptidase family protein [Streptococcus hillyeri]RLY03255.1 CPBP family intramembrane metalloprotease [Streptococcus hillyeri]
MILRQVMEKGKLLLLTVAILFMTFPEVYIPNAWWTGQSWQPLLAYGLYAMTLGLLSALIFWVIRHYKVRAFSLEHFQWRYLGYVVIGYGVMFLVDYLGLLWLYALGEVTTANELALIEEADKLPIVITAIGTVIFGPIAEEVICRSLLNKLFFPHWRFIGILASSLLFGALHGPTNLPSWIIYGGSGLIFATVYEITDDIAYPIALHILNNSLVPLFW